MKIALSGGSGLIGSAIYQNLAKVHEVVQLGRRESSDIWVDFSKLETITTVNFQNCEALIHCAGITDEDFKTNPVSAYIQSTLGIAMLLENAIKQGVRYVVYISSSHVYGPQIGLITENCPPNPLNDYAIAHYATEQTIKRQVLNSKGQVKALILRPNAVFGELIQPENFDRWTLIPFSFPLEAVYQQNIVLKSYGDQRRNFISTIDLAKYVSQFLETAIQFDPFTLVNPIGTETLSIYDFALQCAAIYTNLTHQSCQVSRPELLGHEQNNDFVYQSIHSYYQSTEKLVDYLLSFTQKVINNEIKGHQYGISSSLR